MGIIVVMAIGIAHSQTPPDTVKQLYETEINWDVSDNFDFLDFNKWCYRKPDNLTGDGRLYVSIVDSSYLSIKCDVSDEKGGGISGLNYCRFGFFVTKFRIEGITTGVKSHTHPAIWGYRHNMGEISKVAPVEGNDWMELDWMEYHSWSAPPCWNSDAPPNLDGVREKELRSIMLDNEIKTEFGQWETIGLEYHPDYMQVWEFVNGNWKTLGRKVVAGDEQSKTVMKRSCMQNMYWIISNVYFYHSQGVDGDSWLHVDFFHFYPLADSLSTAVSDHMSFNSTAENQIEIYPNPTNGIAKFESIALAEEILICDINGKLLRIISSPENNAFDISDLKQGIYQIHVLSEERIYSNRILKH
jgi:hypothetical protein